MESGTPLHGKSGVGGNNGETYFYYGCNGIKSISADLLETEAMNVVQDILKKTPRITESVQKRNSDLQSLRTLLVNQGAGIEQQIKQKHEEKTEQLKKLDFLIKDSSLDEIRIFKKEMAARISALDKEIESLQKAKASLNIKIQDSEKDVFDWSKLADQAVKIQKLVKESDPVALKNAYRTMFREIVVGELDEKGNRSLRFILREDGVYGGYVNLADKSCDEEEMAQEEGFSLHQFPTVPFF